MEIALTSCRFEKRPVFTEASCMQIQRQIAIISMVAAEKGGGMKLGADGHNMKMLKQGGRQGGR